MGRHGPKRTYKRADVYDLLASGFDDAYEPWTTPEVADELGCATETARERLDELHYIGDIERKKIGSKAIIWWIPASERDD